VRVSREEFEALVEKAVDDLPEEFQEAIDNVMVMVEEEPSEDDLEGVGIDPDDPRQRLGDEGNGVLFVGERGMITCGGWSGMPRLLPLERHRDSHAEAAALAEPAWHAHQPWLRGSI